MNEPDEHPTNRPAHDTNDAVTGHPVPPWFSCDLTRYPAGTADCYPDDVDPAIFLG